MQEGYFQSILSGLSPMDRNTQFALPGPYKTPLSSDQTAQFGNWAQSGNVPITKDYDMQGFFRMLLQGLARQGANSHFPDTWKTPLHSTFSNESMYAKPSAPHWTNNRLLDEKGKLIVDESK